MRCGLVIGPFCCIDEYMVFTTIYVQTTMICKVNYIYKHGKS